MDFVNLHTHSIYSIRDSIAKIPDLVSKAVELKMPAIALTDHGTLGGLIQFYKTCLSKGVKPLLGGELYVAPKSRFDKDNKNRYYHVTLIAMNNTGWSNLCRLVSESFKPEHFYHKPRIDRELLRAYNEGLLCLSGCLASHLSHTILANTNVDFVDEDGNQLEHMPVECADCQMGLPCDTHTHETVDDVVMWYKSVFGDRYYFEIQNHRLEEEDVVRNQLLELSVKHNVKVLATGDTHFVNMEDVKAHNIMLAVRNGKTITDESFHGYRGDGYYLPTDTYLLQKFNTFENAAVNTMEIADRCNVTFKFGDYRIPTFTDTIYEEDSVFISAAVEGLRVRFNNQPIPPEYTKRLNDEITTIVQMTFPSYFLIVADYVNWAKNSGILIGPGRGSAAGSLVSYSLGITDVDPIKYGLSFSRFLNKGRAAIPQINFTEFPIDKWKQTMTSENI